MPIFDLYGDESVVGNAITYGLVAIPDESAELADFALAVVKAKFGATEQSRIHCRELFAGDRRKKTPWAHLSPAHVFDLCCAVAYAMTKVGARFQVGFVDSLKVAGDLTFGGHTARIPAGSKQLIAFAYAAAVAGLEREPGLESLRFWMDPDTTNIDWGNKRRQAGNIPLTFDSPGPVSRLAPQRIEGAKPPLLDVADVLAYCSAQVLSADDKSPPKMDFAPFAKSLPQASCRSLSAVRSSGLLGTCPARHHDKTSALSSGEFDIEKWESRSQALLENKNRDMTQRRVGPCSRRAQNPSLTRRARKRGIRGQGQNHWRHVPKSLTAS